MSTHPLHAEGAWDYLILTASNEQQATAYDRQLRTRWDLELLPGIRHALVVQDPGGRRIGSGGSTLRCLLEVLRRELVQAAGQDQPETWLEVLRKLRILIVHAGGDSRRLPAYGPCGKVFVPVVSDSVSVLPPTLLDLQLPVLMKVPGSAALAGQIVIASGDVLLRFDPEDLCFENPGITGLACPASPDQARGHGVYCTSSNGQVVRFLQKPSPELQRQQGAVDEGGRVMLDTGLMAFDAETATRLLALCAVRRDLEGRFSWTGEFGAAIDSHGLDFYREICCALGVETTWANYQNAVRAAGSVWDDQLLQRLYRVMAGVASHATLAADCEFLHFGTTRQLIHSGQELLRGNGGLPPRHVCVSINNALSGRARVEAQDSYIEACWIDASVSLPGENLVVGADICEPLELPLRGCLDVLPGRDRSGDEVWFIRCYHSDDQLDGRPSGTVTVCGQPLDRWLELAGVSADELWSKEVSVDKRSGWNARLFPAESHADRYRHWLWMLRPTDATEEQLRAWQASDRYSLQEMAVLADQDRFEQRRQRMHEAEIRGAWQRVFQSSSGFSDADLQQLLKTSTDQQRLLTELIDEAAERSMSRATGQGADAFIAARILHSLGAALQRLLDSSNDPSRTLQRELEDALSRLDPGRLQLIQLASDHPRSLADWADQAREAGFAQLRRAIMTSGASPAVPENTLRSDEIVWGRAPARLDLAGGWTDTPPFSLEFGGCVLNASVLLNGQPPVQAFARVMEEPLIRIRSIDRGTHVDVPDWETLIDFVQAAGEFSLVKAALVLSGFGSDVHGSLSKPSLRQRMMEFGGGLELTTLAAIPKGSGLGTSSILGAVILAVIHRVLGRNLTPTELFHGVLRLEQMLTTGGGWQDQIGGVVDGLKLVSTDPGLVPRPDIRYLPDDALEPTKNMGCTLLYYTGITRLAKGILKQVVGRYLNRDRKTMSTLREIGDLAPMMADAIARKDMSTFGKMIDHAWRLNKRLDPNSTNEEIEQLLARVRPHLFGAKLLGAGGGGFLLMVCKSPEDAAAVRRMLEREPPNPRARFFDFAVSDQGLAVTAT